MGGGKSRKTLELIDAARELLAEIQPASIRAVCYRLFTLDIISTAPSRYLFRVASLPPKVAHIKVRGLFLEVRVWGFRC